LPFEGEGSEGGVAAFAALELHLIVALCPDPEGERGARQFVEGLAQEFRTSPVQ